MITCPICKREFHPRPDKPNQRTCSAQCRNTLTSRETAEKRGDKQRDNGEGRTYRKLYGRHEHRAVAEEKLGRALLPGEVVHHVDGNPRNNHPDNLEILSGQGEHCVLHSTKNRTCSLPDCDRKHMAIGLCSYHYYRSTHHKSLLKAREHDNL